MSVNICRRGMSLFIMRQRFFNHRSLLMSEVKMCPQAVPFRLEAQLEAWQDNLSACCPAPPPAVLALSTAAMTSDLWLKWQGHAWHSCHARCCHIQVCIAWLFADGFASLAFQISQLVTKLISENKVRVPCAGGYCANETSKDYTLNLCYVIYTPRCRHCMCSWF
jgi:hypothetical protein